MSSSFLDLAQEVLKSAATPLSYQDIWAEGERRALTKKLGTTGKTPWRTLGSRLYVDVRDNPASKFIAVGKRPVRFFLKARAGELSSDVIEKLERAERKPDEVNNQAGSTLLEKELHPLLAYFVYSNPSFNRGRKILTKTIIHSKSTKGGYNEWIHPDMVGFYLPLDDWEPNVIEFNRVSDNNSLKLFSFELKRKLNRSNYRESYFQAVSNSSWSHEGYLVAAEVLNDDDFLAELDRLTSSFGIGLIHLDVQDVDASTVVFPARRRDSLDWETVNKLCEQNRDFANFLRDVKIDFDAREIHAAKYDPIMIDIASATR